MTRFGDVFHACTLLLRYQTKIVSHESILYQINFVNSILLFAHVHLSVMSKKEKGDYNFDVKHQERSFDVKFDRDNDLCRQYRNSQWTRHPQVEDDVSTDH